MMSTPTPSERVGQVRLAIVSREMAGGCLTLSAGRFAYVTSVDVTRIYCEVHNLESLWKNGKIEFKATPEQTEVLNLAFFNTY